MNMQRRGFFKSLFGGAAVLELPGVESAQILRLESGDTIVIKLRGHAHQKVMEQIRAMAQQKFPDNKILVTDNDTDISIIKG